LNFLSGVSADHSTVEDYAAGMEGADSHSVVGSGNAEATSCGSTN